MINFTNSDFCKLLRLWSISALQISKKHFVMFDFFVKMKLLSTFNATTLIWLPTWLTTRKTGEKCKYKKSKLAKNNCMRLQNDSSSMMTSEDALYRENHRERYFTLIFWPRNRMFLISSRFYMTKGGFDLKDVQ